MEGEHWACGVAILGRMDTYLYRQKILGSTWLWLMLKPTDLGLLGGVKPTCPGYFSHE